MDKKRAIEVLRIITPTNENGRHVDAVEIAIAAIEESMVQKPPHNSQSASASQIAVLSAYCTSCGQAFSFGWNYCPKCGDKRQFRT